MTRAKKCERDFSLFDMKNILLATLLFIPVALGASELPKNLDGYIATDRFVPGTTIKIEFPPDFQEAIAPLNAAVEKVRQETPNVLQEILKDYTPDEPLPYDSRLGITKKQYDAYLAGWNKRTIVPAENVQIRLNPEGENKWKLQAFAAGPQGGLVPIALHNLSYDATKDAWISPNGELTRKDDVSFGKDHLWGEWKGSSWVCEAKDSLSTVVERLTVGKFTKTNDIILFYNIAEVSSAGQGIARNGFIIRILAKDMKKDPLKESAARNAKEKGRRR